MADLPTLTPTQESISARVFGTGLDLLEVAPGAQIGFDIVIARDDAGGASLRTAEGPDNLANDLRVALLTPTGNDMFNVAFGFDGLLALTQPYDRRMIAEFLRLSVVKTLGLDARIKQVLNVTLEPASGGDGDPNLERRWKVVVEAQTILGDVMRLVLGEVDTNG